MRFAIKEFVDLASFIAAVGIIAVIIRTILDTIAPNFLQFGSFEKNILVLMVICAAAFVVADAIKSK